MHAWMWLVFGLGLCLVELVNTSFFVIFFGLGAFVVGLCMWAGFHGPEWQQWLLFSAASLASLAVFRSRLVKRFRVHKEVSSLSGDYAVATEVIAPGAEGRAEMRGTTWTIHNASELPIAVGQKCRVERVEGLTLIVK